MRKFLIVLVILSGGSALAEPLSDALITKHRVAIALVLGMAPPMWEVPGGFDAGDPSLSVELFFSGNSNDAMAALFRKKTKALAEALGFLNDQSGTTGDEQAWQTRLYFALRPLLKEALVTYESRPDLKVDQLKLLRDWDRDCSWAFVIGSYCRFGHDRYIGYLATPRALLIADVIPDLDPERGFHVTTAFGYIPGGSRVELESPFAEKIAAEAKALLETAAKGQETRSPPKIP